MDVMASRPGPEPPPHGGLTVFTPSVVNLARTTRDGRRSRLPGVNRYHVACPLRPLDAPGTNIRRRLGDVEDAHTRGEDATSGRTTVRRPTHMVDWRR